MTIHDERMDAAQALEDAREAYWDAMGTAHEADAEGALARAEALCEALSEEPDPDYDPCELERDDEHYDAGPARLHDDGYYARNDAGEYSWM